MPNSIVHNLLEACRAEGCPICRLEEIRVERYLANQFYENVNSPKWRDRLRASRGFCREHAWLGVNKRLGDALGYSIIYHDILNSILMQWNDLGNPVQPPRRRISEGLRDRIASITAAFAPHKACPVCEHRDEATETLLTVLLEELNTPEMADALQASDGLCLPHLRAVLEKVKDISAADVLFNLHRERLEGLKGELAEFIRKNDYQVIREGFGKEGDAWLRVLAIVSGRRE